MGVVRRLKQTAPIIIGEWGYRGARATPADGYALPLLAYTAELIIGWIARVWCPYCEPPQLAAWDDYQPTEFGMVVMGALGGGDRKEAHRIAWRY